MKAKNQKHQRSQTFDLDSTGLGNTTFITQNLKDYAIKNHNKRVPKLDLDLLENSRSDEKQQIAPQPEPQTSIYHLSSFDETIKSGRNKKDNREQTQFAVNRAKLNKNNSKRSKNRSCSATGIHMLDKFNNSYNHEVGRQGMNYRKFKKQKM